MKNLTSIVFILFTAFSFAQSLSGNFNSSTTKTALGYGNVDIYRGDKLVASVLTDKKGNFKVDLDTGMYRCVLNYAGYESITKMVHVVSDEKADFSAKEDPSRRKPKPKTRTESEETFEGLMVRSKAPATTTFAPDGIFDGDYKSDDRIMLYGGATSQKGQSNKLTAGEINDFAKWTMWQDIAKNELEVFEKSWDISPKARYTVEVHGKTGLPVVDAVVRLKIKDAKTLFTARTDNTGKAELWLTIKNENPVIDGRLQIEIEHQGKTSKITDVNPFEKSINHQVLNISCEENENVDIAFVVDATGSMQDELSFLQAELNDIIFQSKQISSKLNFRFANVFYRDNGAEEYLTRKMDFNRVLSESVQFIDEQKADGGGDYEEAVEVALDSAINGLSWSVHARARILFLVLDAPPHNTVENQEKLRKVIEQAAAKGIRIVPIGASGINKSTEYLMRAMALGTNGTYTFLTDHSGIGNSHIAPSTDHFDVETLNKLMIRIIKSYTYMPDCQQNMPDLQLDYPDSLVFVPERADSLIQADSLQKAANDSLVNVRWSYYPNPTDGIVNIEADVDIQELYITDLSGKVLQIVKNLEKQRSVQIDLSNYSSGIYLIRYPLGKNWVTGKVVLQRYG